MKKDLLRAVFTFVFLFTITVSSKAQTWTWAKNSVANNGDEARSITTDINNNVIIVGGFESSPISFGTNTLSNAGSFDIYIVKYDGAGNVLWAKRIGGTGYEFATSVKTDINGDIFVTGYFSSSTLNFGTSSLTLSGFTDVFLVKFDTNGNFIWARGSAATGGGFVYNMSNSVDVDNGGNAIITGYFSSDSIGFGAYTLTNTTSSGDVFFVKYDTNGNILWAKQMSGSGDDQANSISVDPFGNILILGNFESPTLTINSTVLNNGGIRNVFLAKLNSNGNILWATNGVGYYKDDGNNVACDNSANIYITGIFRSSQLAFGSYSLTNSGITDMFLAKYDPNGNALWARNGIGAGYDAGWGLSAFSGGVFVTGSLGSYAGNPNTPVILGSFTLTPVPSYFDATFIAHYDPNGNVIYATELDGGGDDWSSVCIDHLCNVYITGDYSWGCPNPFVIGVDSFIVPSGGTESIFLAKMSYTCQTVNLEDNKESSKEILVYPNPSLGSFKLQIDSEIEKGEIILMNSLGQKVHEQKIIKGKNEINPHNLAKGLYHYTLSENKQVIHNGKMVVN